MTLLAVHLAVAARMGVDILTGLGMTRDTYRFDILDPVQIHLHGMMRAVASLTVFHCIMRLIRWLMAPAAGGNRIFPLRGMFLMAIQTAHFSFMKSSPLIDILYLLQMAFHTILI